MPPHPGSEGQNRQRKWWRFSRSVGAANAATVTCRGSSAAVSRRMAPPLPEASQPSKTTDTGGPSSAVADQAATHQPQREQASLRRLELRLALAAAELCA